MPKFSTHVALMNPEYQPANFAPGDEVPGWAIDQVGDHVLEPEVESADANADAPDFTGGADASDDESVAAADDEGEAGDEETDQPADAPDFTAPAPARRGRTRKQ